MTTRRPADVSGETYSSKMYSKDAAASSGTRTFPSLDGLRDALEWLAGREGVRPDWYLEDAAWMHGALTAAVFAEERADTELRAVQARYTKAELIAMCFAAYERELQQRSSSAIRELERRAVQIETLGETFQSDASALRRAVAILEQFATEETR